MGTLLFLILRFILKYNTAGYDWVIFCFLVSLDSIAITQFLKTYIKK
ncbi:MAG: hypothetical protein NC935_01885 [Candidatus Omnitrophica bacterium]|nr:hypothetical protein [Candidatus Omnitrophota bacterium]